MRGHKVINNRQALAAALKSPALVLAWFNWSSSVWVPVIRTNKRPDKEALFLMFEGIFLIDDRRSKWSLLGAASVDDDDVEAALRRLDPQHDFRLFGPHQGEA